LKSKILNKQTARPLLSATKYDIQNTNDSLPAKRYTLHADSTKFTLANSPLCFLAAAISESKVPKCVPSWRSDIYREADLIEEIARVYGYDKVPAENKITIEVAPVDKRQKTIDALGTYLTGCGFYETVTISFIDAGAAELFAATNDKQYLSVKDVTRTGTNLLRQSVLPSLFGVLKANHNVGNTPCRIFEIADTYIPAQAGQLPVEKTRLAIAADSDYRDIRVVVEGLLKILAPDSTIKFEPAVRQDSPQATIGWAQADLNGETGRFVCRFAKWNEVSS